VTKTPHLFPVTNVFVQRQALSAVDWKKLGNFDDIALEVCRPIQDEIDDMKGRGGGCVTDRARASSMFREVLKSGVGKIIREAGPRVRSTMALMLKPIPDLAGWTNRQHRSRCWTPLWPSSNR
jgi:hypothetical protein